MKQFFKVFEFELRTFFTNKTYVGITLFLMVASIVVMYIPNIINLVAGGNSTPEPGQETGAEFGSETEGSYDKTIILSGTGVDFSEVSVMLSQVYSGANIVSGNLSEEEISSQILAGEADFALVFNGLRDYTYVVENVEMYDETPMYISSLIEYLYKSKTLSQMGLNPEEINSVMSTGISYEVKTLGVDRMQNFFYTYIMIFALYMCVLMYGNMISTNVANEKSSRAMELLITSVKPQSMMFGKVFASCLAGFLQLVLVFGTAVLVYSLNGKSWGDNIIITSLFGMPLSLFAYMIVFFVLGFLLYGFLLGAAGSTVSKLEDVSAAIMPVTLLFVAGFLVVMLSMSSGNIDTPLMMACSFIPFTSPMAMFTRIAMGSVPGLQVAASLGILLFSVVFIGYLAAKIYRVGVLLYGVKPGIKTIIGALKRA